MAHRWLFGVVVRPRLDLLFRRIIAHGKGFHKALVRRVNSVRRADLAAGLGDGLPPLSTAKRPQRSPNGLLWSLATLRWDMRIGDGGEGALPRSGRRSYRVAAAGRSPCLFPVWYVYMVITEKSAGVVLTRGHRGCILLVCADTTLGNADNLRGQVSKPSRRPCNPRID